MKNQKKKSFPRRVFLWLLAILLAVCIAFDIYVSDYYHTDPAAEDAMVSDRFVSVTEQNGNWVFVPESPTAGLMSASRFCWNCRSSTRASCVRPSSGQ